MDKVTVLNDISYGAHERHRLDIFIPESVKHKEGIILFIHGGGWQDGDKTIHHPDAEYFCERGIICASMNYRFVTDELTVFDELDDISEALEALKGKCSELGFEIKKLILSGGSAGGHLSLFYAYTRKERAPVRLVAACVYCPPVIFGEPDFLMGISGEFEEWKYKVISKCCGFPVTKETLSYVEVQNALMNISPINYVNKQCIPTAVFYGKNDELVPVGHIEKFLLSLKNNGVKHDALLFKNSNHALDRDPEAKIESRNIIESYAERYF